MPCRASIFPSLSPTATRICSAVKSTATTVPGGRSRVTARALRPLEEVFLTETVPAVRNPRTMFETLAAERPVALASSAWVRVPSRRKTSTMRASVAWRNADCDPGVASLPVTTYPFDLCCGGIPMLLRGIVQALNTRGNRLPSGLPPVPGGVFPTSRSWSVHPRLLRARKPTKADQQAKRYPMHVRTDRPGWQAHGAEERKSTRLNSSHVATSYAVICVKENGSKERTRIP